MVAFESTGGRGNFSVLLIPGADTKSVGNSFRMMLLQLNSFNIRFGDSIVFDTSDTQTLIDAFIEEYELDDQLIAEVQSEIVNNQTDEQIAKTTFESKSSYGQ